MVVKTHICHRILHRLVPTYLSGFISHLTRPPALLYSASNHMFAGRYFDRSVTVFV